MTLAKFMADVNRSRPLVARKIRRSSAMGRLHRPHAVSEREAPNESHAWKAHPELPLRLS